ncbi:MAG: phosphoribosylamine--glycine ligase [Geothrix sp.]|uniref:phosphoribosylamine--glycine ligase n=1 Tax=Geothrix sp. TaxID=1962974 RepID=UPI0018111575|nr:phosphoribosylamine--glycine ligase [Geothrix sp.]NWJ39949.1 phosphoribosylamine--glycine ligase [Geothrix sp.]WIL22039.1 MAG: phosphoribosylamine--glycine ligase [Geothrix sp.]
MKILLLGSGGREYALALKLRASATPVELVSAPGSDALAELGQRVELDLEQPASVAEWCALHHPDLVVAGPEVPLVAGVADAVRALGIPCFGHDAATARLEGSKAFAKDFMSRHGIPCAASHTVSDLATGEALIGSWSHGFPIVLKADGLAAGKGVVLAQSEAEALDTFRAFMAGQFGDASRTVVFEAPLVGMELSLHVLVDVDADHAAYALLPACQDHKRIFEQDRGPNTGGMGAFGPLPFLHSGDIERMRVDLVQPTVRGLQKDGLTGRGVLFLGVMWTAKGPELLEYNVRFGDPETQVLMQLLDEDLAALLLEVAEGRLASRDLKLKPHTAIAVVLAAEDYPEGARKGVSITIGNPQATLIHAGTRKQDGQWLTNGGRVLNLATSAPDLAAARAVIEASLPEVHWPGMQVRRDIGLKALRHAEAGRTVQDPW